MKSTDGNKFIIAGIIASILFWVAESILHIIFFHGTGLLNQIFSPGILELWLRVLVIALIFVISCYSKRNFETVSEHKNIEDFVKIQRDISIRLGLDENLDDTLNACIGAAIEISGMDSGGIYFVNEATGDLTLAYYKGLSDEFFEECNYYPADSEKALLIKPGNPSYFKRDELSTSISSVQKEENICSVAIVPIKSGGRVIAVLNISSHVHDKIPNNVHDAIEGMAVQIGNVIDKAKKANELIASEKKYKILFESSKEAIAVIKPPEWKFIACNPATLDLFRIDNENELLTKTPEETSPEYQPDGQKSSVKARKMIETAVREGAHFFEWTHIDSGGSPIPTTVYLVRIEIEEEQCLLATMRDISESKEAELQMKRLRDYLKSIINSMPSVLIGVDTKGMVTHWNQEAEKMTGIAAEDACGKPLLEVYPELEGEIDNVGMAISSGEIQEDLKVARYVNDEVCYKNITVYPIISGDVSGVVIREDDVTEREKLQDVIAQAEKMNSLGGLAAGMAHEINTPLAVIIQNAAVAWCYRRYVRCLSRKVYSAQPLINLRKERSLIVGMAYIVWVIVIRSNLILFYARVCKPVCAD
jgi:PAS domain S-box-containing protein